MTCGAVYEDPGDKDAPYVCGLLPCHDDWHQDQRDGYDVSWNSNDYGIVIELGEELSDWSCGWPKVNGHVIGSEKCNCGHQSLEPGWHDRSCRAVVDMWKARAKILHEQVWELLTEVKALDSEYGKR